MTSTPISTEALGEAFLRIDPSNEHGPIDYTLGRLKGRNEFRFAVFQEAAKAQGITAFECDKRGCHEILYLPNGFAPDEISDLFRAHYQTAHASA